MSKVKSAFVIMPFTLKGNPEKYSEDPDHWNNVYIGLIKPALDKLEFISIRDDMDLGSRSIIGDIFNKIESADLILCDLSSHNPNVFLELGWALRSDKPYVLIKDDKTDYNFDLNQQFTFTYDSKLRPKTLQEEIQKLSNIIKETYEDENKRYSIIAQLAIRKLNIENYPLEELQKALIPELKELIQKAAYNFGAGSAYLARGLSEVTDRIIYRVNQLNTAMRLTENIIRKTELDELIYSELGTSLESINFRNREQYQISVISKKEKTFLYHDYDHFLNVDITVPVQTTSAALYDAISTSEFGAISWIDSIRNKELEINERLLGRNRLSIAIFNTINDKIILGEIHL